MKIYNLKQKQFLPVSIEEAWNFFTNPKNLTKITPDGMEFIIDYISGDEKKTYAGQIIKYRIKIFPGMTVKWTTEITHLKENHYFVDEQRFGPYSLWHHQHHFKEVDGGVEMTDEVNYAMPFGLLGKFAHWLWVGREVKRIFDYRFQ